MKYTSIKIYLCEFSRTLNQMDFCFVLFLFCFCFFTALYLQVQHTLYYMYNYNCKFCQILSDSQTNFVH